MSFGLPHSNKSFTNFMTLCVKKNTDLLSNEIENLNYDIKKCEENLFGKKNYCTPSCCCHCFTQYWTMSQHKNYVCMTKKKSDNNTITKLDIIPRCNNLKETCVTERAIVDVVVKKSPFKNDVLKNRKRNSRYEVSKKVDAATDPILFSSKDNKKYRDRPWRVILKDNLNEANSKHCCHRCSSESVQTSSESTTSSQIDKQPLSQHCFTKKNVSVQCDDFKDITDIEISPIERVQFILKQLKQRLKDNAYMGNKVDELEKELHKIFDFNINSQLFPVKEENSAKNNYLNFLTSKKIFSPPISEIDNNSLLKLDETCRELENTCLTLKKERDTSLQIVAEKTAELMESKMREADIKRKFVETDSKIQEFSVKLENYAFSIKNLSDHINKLQNENKELKMLEQHMTNLKGILKTVINENKTLLAELEQVTIERNKLQLARTVKEHQKIQSENICSSSTELLIPELSKELKTNESEVKKEFTKNAASGNSSSNTLKSSPSLVLPPPFLYRSNSISSLKSSSSLSEEEKDEIISDILNQQSSHSVHQTKLTDLNKLKEEVNNIFAEIKHLSDYIPSRPVIQLSTENFSSDLSENNGTSSVKDVRQVDLDKK